MYRSLLFLAAMSLAAVPARARADAFDHYVNPILMKVPSAAGVQAVKQLTPRLIAEHNRILPGTVGAFIVVKTKDGRLSKLLVEIGQQKRADRPTLPVLLIERYVTYKEGQERTIKASGQNLTLFNGFRLDLDLGQVVPPELAGDLRFVSADGQSYVEPVGKAELYLLTRPMPEAAPKKSARMVPGAVFQSRYFAGSYQLYDDGRRSGKLTLHVADDGEVTGAYYSDRDGQKYEVKGKIGPARHAIRFSIQFPKVEQFFHGWLFTGDAKALAGSSRMLEREAGFYAVRVEDE